MNRFDDLPESDRRCLYSTYGKGASRCFATEKLIYVWGKNQGIEEMPSLFSVGYVDKLGAPQTHVLLREDKYG